MSDQVRVAILGATGAVGTELIELLESRNFPVSELKLLASPRSAGKTLSFRDEEVAPSPVHSKTGRNLTPSIMTTKAMFRALKI